MKKNIFKTLVLALMVIIALGITPIQTNAAPMLSKRKVTLTVGKSITLKSKLKTNKKWKTSNNKVIKISKKKAKSVRIKAIKPGSATISVKVGKKTYKCKVTVKKTKTPVKTSESNSDSGSNSKNNTVVNFDKSAVSVVAGSSVMVPVSIANAKGSTSWGSHNSAVAEVDNSGKVTGIKPGTAQIWVKNNGVSDMCVVTVTAPSNGYTYDYSQWYGEDGWTSITSSSSIYSYITASNENAFANTSITVTEVNGTSVNINAIDATNVPVNGENEITTINGSKWVLALIKTFKNGKYHLYCSVRSLDASGGKIGIKVNFAGLSEVWAIDFAVGDTDYVPYHKELVRIIEASGAAAKSKEYDKMAAIQDYFRDCKNSDGNYRYNYKGSTASCYDFILRDGGSCTAAASVILDICDKLGISDVKRITGKEAQSGDMDWLTHELNHLTLDGKPYGIDLSVIVKYHISSLWKRNAS